MLNKEFIALFQITQKYSKKSLKMIAVYNRIKFTDKLLQSFINSYSKFTDVKSFFLFKAILVDCELTQEDETQLKAMLVDINIKCQQTLLKNQLAPVEHSCSGDDCCKKDDALAQMLGGSKMKKLLKKKGIRQRLEKEMSKQTGQKGNLEDMLLSTVKDNATDGQWDMINKLMQNDTVKNMMGKLTDDGNMEKIKALIEEFMVNEEIKTEVENIISLFNKEKLKTVFSTLMESMKDINSNIDISNPKSIMKLVAKVQSLLEDNPDIQEIIYIFENAIQNDLINQEKIMAIISKLSGEFMDRIKELNLFDTKTMFGINMLAEQFGVKDLLSSFTGESVEEEQEKTKTKEELRQEKRERRRKTNRRQKRAELKAQRGKSRN